MPRVSRATTLIELLVVIVVLSISAAILFPRLHRSQTESARLTRSANELMQVIRHAQNLAIGTQTVHMLHLDLEAQVYWISVRSFQGEDMPLDKGLGLRRTLSQGIFFAQVLRDDLQDTIETQVTWPFDPEGRGIPGSVTLRGEQGQTLEIEVRDALDLNGPCFVRGGEHEAI